MGALAAMLDEREMGKPLLEGYLALAQTVLPPSVLKKARARLTTHGLHVAIERALQAQGVRPEEAVAIMSGPAAHPEGVKLVDRMNQAVVAWQTKIFEEAKRA